MGGPTKKARLNVTVDRQIYEQAKLRFPALGMGMSSFIEGQLALFLHATEPLKEILTAESPAPADVKAALRAFSAHGVGVVGGQMKDFAEVIASIQDIEDIQTKK